MYESGDEAKIVDLLNMCFGDWGTLSKWRGLYEKYPTFDKQDVFVIENGEKIVGHEALHFRELVIGNNAVSTVSLSDAAVNPEYRGLGLHNRLLDVMLHSAKTRGATMVFSWYLRDTGLHRHSKGIGFSEIKQSSAYMRIIRPEKVLRSGLLDFLHKSPNLETALDDLSGELYFRLGNSSFSIAELFGKPSQRQLDGRKKTEIIFDERALPTLIRFRNMSKRQRLWNLIWLIIRRRARVRFGSFSAFANMTRKGISIFGSI